MSTNALIIKSRLGGRYLKVRGYEKFFQEVPLSTQFLGVDEERAYLTLYRPHRLQSMYDIYKAMPQIGWIGRIRRRKRYVYGWIITGTHFSGGDAEVESPAYVTYLVGNDNPRDIYYLAVFPPLIREELLERIKRA